MLSWPLTGFVTAKVGRPDVYRSGAFILRQLHSSSIPWGFRPPFAGDAASQGSETQEGIWLREFVPKAGSGWVDYIAREGESGEEHEDQGEGSSEEEDEYSDEEEDSADEKAVKAIQSVFSALAVEGEDSEEDDSEGGLEAEDEDDDNEEESD